MSVKSDKDKQKVTQEKYQAILSELLKLEENKYCVDCDAKGPRWASWNLGVFLCIRCAGIHRNLGVHLSRVKSVNLDSWTAEQIAMVQEVGNGKGRAIYEANLPDNFRRPQTDSALEALIRAKYEHKKYLARDWNVSQAKIATVSSAQELSKKEKKRSKDQLPAQEGLRGLTYVKNASDSNLASSKTTDRSDNQLAAKSASVQLQKTRKPDQQAADSLPNIELITLASPETYPKPDATEFGSFLSASVPPITDSTASSSNAAAGASSDLADLEFFNGIAQQTVSGSSSSASGTCGLATKDDIMALFGPPTSANVFGVPGGMYMPRQQIMCQPGMMQATTGIGYPVMANGMPMMQPIAMTPVSQVVNGSLGHVPVTAPPPYGLYQGYASTQMQPSVSSLASNNGVVWCPQAIPSQQAQQTVAGHTLSNVLWQ